MEGAKINTSKLLKMAQEIPLKQTKWNSTKKKIFHAKFQWLVQRVNDVKIFYK